MFLNEDSSKEEVKRNNNSSDEPAPYNGRWTDSEHDKFIEALRLYGKNWNKVHKYVGTRTSAQTRSHAQKYFNKLIRIYEVCREDLSKDAIEHLSIIGFFGS